jgi:integrase
MGIYSNQSKKSKHSKFWVLETFGYRQALPSETLSLRWDDIDWEMNRMSIPEPTVEHHEGRGIRSCPIFPELRPILDEAFEIFGHKSEYVVAAPQYRAAANTAMGWKNANLRSEMTRLLRRAGVSGWPRLFHSMRASRQTELQREFPLHVVCSWLGNSPRIAQQSYLLVTDDDFAKAAGARKVMLL